MKAYEVNENQFFSRGNSGGTIVSTGLEAVVRYNRKKDIILKIGMYIVFNVQMGTIGLMTMLGLLS